jgi:hypothetical protein
MCPEQSGNNPTPTPEIRTFRFRATSHCTSDDPLARILTPAERMITTTIPEAEITEFCKSCDNFYGHGVKCVEGKKYDTDEQAHAVLSRLCFKAVVNGVPTYISEVNKKT